MTDEHRPHGARAHAGRAGRHQGPVAVHRAEAAARRHAERRHGRRHRAQDGHQGVGDGACSTSATTAAASASWSAPIEQKGMSQMFHLMNYARIGVGIQGLALASSAYLNALDYAQGAQAGQLDQAVEGRDRAARADHRAPRRAPHAARHEGARRGHPRARGQADDAHRSRQRDREDRRRQGRRRVPQRPGRSAGAAAQGVRQRSGVPDLRDRDPGLRRRRLPQGLAGRAVLPRLEDLLDLRGHQPHPGDGSGRPQADAARRRQRPGVRQGRRRRSSPRTSEHPVLKDAIAHARAGDGGADRRPAASSCSGSAAARWRWCRRSRTASSR